MAINVNSIISRAQTVLQDVTGVRWPELELLDWMNDAQREVVMLHPQAGAKTTDVPLTPGSKQTIPNDGTQFLRAIRNVGGRAVREVDRDILDSQLPDWHTESGAAVLHYTHDPIDQRVFYVYPAASGSLTIVYAASPPDSTIGSTIKVPDIYANALLDYVLYRAYSKDAEATQNAELADRHLRRFVESLGLKSQVDAAQVYQTKVKRASPVGS